MKYLYYLIITFNNETAVLGSKSYQECLHNALQLKRLVAPHKVELSCEIRVELEGGGQLRVLPDEIHNNIKYEE